MERLFKVIQWTADAFVSVSSSRNRIVLETLPDELLLATMSLLAVADLASLACVCRRFADLSCDESLSQVHVARLTCRSPSQVTKPASRSWYQHYRRLSTPPTFATFCRDLPESRSYAVLGDWFYAVTAAEIVKYRVPAEPGPMGEGDVVGRLASAEGRQWTRLTTLGPAMLVAQSRPPWASGVGPEVDERFVLLSPSLEVLQTMRPPPGPYAWLLFDRQLVAVSQLANVMMADGSTTRGVADRNVGRLPFRIGPLPFEFVAAKRSFGAIIDTASHVGMTSAWVNPRDYRSERLKFVEISTERSDRGGRVAPATVLDAVGLPLPELDSDPYMMLTCVNDAYLVLSLVTQPTARLDVFVVRTRHTTAIELPLEIDEESDLQYAVAPATGLLYVSLKPRESHSILLLALNSSGACLW